MWVRERGVPFGLHAGASLSTWTDPPHPPWAVSVWGWGFDTSSERERNTYPFPLTKTILRLLFKQHHLTKQHRLKQKHSPRTILPIERRKACFQTWKRKMSHFYLDVGAVHLGTSFRKSWARLEQCFADLFVMRFFYINNNRVSSIFQPITMWKCVNYLFWSMQVCLCGERKALVNRLSTRSVASLQIHSSTTLAKNFLMLSLRVQLCFFYKRNILYNSIHYADASLMLQVLEIDKMLKRTEQSFFYNDAIIYP